MSDKEAARKIHNWMLGGVHAEIASCHTCDQIAELLAGECRAPAPQPADEAKRLIHKAVMALAGEISGRKVADALLALADLRELVEVAATPQVTPTEGNFCTGDQDCRHACELELDREADGRWLAEFMRFPGVAAYGPSKAEAIRNAAKVLIESEQASPTPESCPNCSSEAKSIERWPCAKRYGGKADPWHSSASTPKGTK